MSFRWPYLLLALPLILAALLVLFAGSRRAREKFLAQFAAARLLPLLLASYSPALRKFKNILLAIGLSFVVVSLARPQWGYDWQEQRARGVDVIFAIDTSKSMLSQDIQPSRLERAKLAIYDCLEKMGNNRVGLVAFAGDAFLQCPLTLDYDAFRQSLDAVDTQSIAQGGTNIAAGLHEAAAALEKSGNHKIIVLITDGEDLEGGGIQEARDLHENEGVTVYTVGVGTAQGELIPVRDARGRADYLRDAGGQLVKSSLDSATLTKIAESTGGFYQPLGATGEGLTRIYDEGIKHITQDSLTSRLQRQPLERFQWPLAAGLLILAVESLIGTRRPSWRRATVETATLSEPLPPVIVKKQNSTPPRTAGGPPPLVAALLLAAVGLACSPRAQAAQDAAAPAPADNTAPTSTAANAGENSTSATPTPTSKAISPKNAQNLFQQGDYKGSAEAYGRASTAAPQDWRFRYNQGAALYRDKDYEAAAQAFTQTLASPDLSLQQRSYYNLGNAHYRLGQSELKEDPKKTVERWESAVKDYESALELNPRDDDARYNLDLIKKQLEELKKKLEEQEKQKQQQDQQNQQKQDQQQKNDQNQQNNDKNQQQNQQNQSGQGQDQNQQQNNSDQQNQQNQQGQNQNSPPNQANQNQPNQNETNNPQAGRENQPGNRGSRENQPQNRGQEQRGNQAQRGENQNANQQRGNQNPAQAKPENGQNKEPASANAGQQPKPQPAGAGNAAAGASAGDKQGKEGEGMVAVPGVLTREEARLILDALKTSERKLPAVRYMSANQTSNEPDQPRKDW